MGRSRRRARAAAGGAAAPRRTVAAAPAAPSPAELRRSLGAYLGGAILLAILVLVATVALAPAWAPWAVLAIDAVATLALYSWAQRRLSGLALSGEDRVLQTLATGLLGLVFVFALVAAIVLTAS